MSADEQLQSIASFVHFRAFAVVGLTLGAPEVDLGEIAPGVRLFVSQNIDERCRPADRALAIAELLLRGLFAPDTLPTAPDRIEQVVQRNVAERTKGHGKGPFLVAVAEGSIPDIRTADLRHIEGMLVGFDAFNKDKVRAPLEELITPTLTAVALTFPSVVGFQSILDQVVAYQSQAPIFSYTPKMGSARARVDHQLDVGELPAVVRRATQRTPKDLARVQQLLLRSLLVDDDRLRSFLAAWTGLEILVNKLFSRYERSLFTDLSRDRADPLPQYLEQMRQVMSSRYRLRDKFVVVAAALDPVGASEDLGRFEAAKKLRDGLSHGDDVSDESLPLEEVSRLLRKYLGLHLDGAA